MGGPNRARVARGRSHPRQPNRVERRRTSGSNWRGREHTHKHGRARMPHRERRGAGFAREKGGRRGAGLGVPKTQRFWGPAGAAAMLSRGRRRRRGAASGDDWAGIRGGGALLLLLLVLLFAASPVGTGRDTFARSCWRGVPFIGDDGRGRLALFQKSKHVFLVLVVEYIVLLFFPNRGIESYIVILSALVFVFDMVFLCQMLELILCLACSMILLVTLSIRVGGFSYHVSTINTTLIVTPCEVVGWPSEIHFRTSFH